MLNWKRDVKNIQNNLFEDLTGVVHWDVLNVKHNQDLILEILSTNSEYRQGIRLAVDVGEGYIEINGVRSREMQLWEDTCTEKIKIKCVSSEGKLSVYNIFDVGVAGGGIKSQMDSCGMLIEDREGCMIYRCNDSGFKSAFDKLEFKIRPL